MTALTEVRRPRFTVEPPYGGYSKVAEALTEVYGRTRAQKCDACYPEPWTTYLGTSRPGDTVYLRCPHGTWVQRVPPRFIRQMVYAWWRRRAFNGFPEQVRIPADELSPEERSTIPYQKDGTVLLFDVGEVLTWYATFEPSSGGRRAPDELPFGLERSSAPDAGEVS